MLWIFSYPIDLIEKTETSSDTRYDIHDDLIEIFESWRESSFKQSFIIEQTTRVTILDQIAQTKNDIVRFDHSIENFWWT